MWPCWLVLNHSNSTLMTYITVHVHEALARFKSDKIFNWHAQHCASSGSHPYIWINGLFLMDLVFCSVFVEGGDSCWRKGLVYGEFTCSWLDASSSKDRPQLHPPVHQTQSVNVVMYLHYKCSWPEVYLCVVLFAAPAARWVRITLVPLIEPLRTGWQMMSTLIKSEFTLGDLWSHDPKHWTLCEGLYVWFQCRRLWATGESIHWFR